MPFRITPRDERFFLMFVEAARNLVSATDLLAGFVQVSSNRDGHGRDHPGPGHRRAPGRVPRAAWVFTIPAAAAVAALVSAAILN